MEYFTNLGKIIDSIVFYNQNKYQLFCKNYILEFLKDIFL